MLLIHTEKGQRLFEKAKNDLAWIESNEIDCWQNMLERPTPRPDTREIFWNDYYNRGIDFVMKKYGTVSTRNKLKSKLLKILGGGYRTK